MSLYLPTLSTPFDFVDDGNLVYPTAARSIGERIQVLWDKIKGNYVHLGPFRPVLWAHWEAEANLLRADAFRWRCARLLWGILAAFSLLWLLHELGFPALAAISAAALAMWNPYRNEIWTSLTLSEGVAMPYALVALACAIRAARSARPWPWDLVGALCVLAALGCKNTFAALVPAQFVLRIFAGDGGWRECWRSQSRRACLLASTLFLPVCHYLFFKLNWHPGQYETRGLTWAQAGRMLSAILGALSIGFIGPAFLLALLAIALNPGRPSANGERIGLPRRFIGAFGALQRKDLIACLAGLVLLCAGVAVYLPMGAVSGRYSMPAIWGADILLAALLSALAAAQPGVWKRSACIALACGLIVVAVANVGRQEKFAARARLLWQALEYVEREAPRGATLVWMDGPALNVEEGIHFAWHLHARGRDDLSLCVIDQTGRPISRAELTSRCVAPQFVLTGSASVPTAATELLREFRTSYWSGTRSYGCYLFATENQAWATR
jgi:hypothetical protein